MAKRKTARSASRTRTPGATRAVKGGRGSGSTARKTAASRPARPHGRGRHGRARRRRAAREAEHREPERREEDAAATSDGARGARPRLGREARARKPQFAARTDTRGEARRPHGPPPPAHAGSKPVCHHAAAPRLRRGAARRTDSGRSNAIGASSRRRCRRPPRPWISIGVPRPPAPGARRWRSGCRSTRPPVPTSRPATWMPTGRRPTARGTKRPVATCRRPTRRSWPRSARLSASSTPTTRN